MDKKNLEIPYTKDNIIRCLCPTCPVQQNSACVKKKMMDFQEVLQSSEDPKPEDYPGMYCSNGKADCTDIDTRKDCICPDCPVYKKYDLKVADPAFLYCKDGKAWK